MILATGSHERPLVFADNDRPGIMLAESVRAYINRFAVAPGRQIVFATNGASAYAAAADAKAAGLAVDPRRHPPRGRLRRGRRRLAGARMRGPDRTYLGRVDRPDPGDRARRGAPRVRTAAPAPAAPCPCDCVGLSGGWTPAIHLFSQSRGKPRFEPAIDAFVPGQSVQAERSVGSANGSYQLGACLNEGWSARGGGRRTTDASRRARSREGFTPVRVLPSDRNPSRVKAFVDFQNDVTAKDIKLAVREGFESIEHVKRYTTTGMATDQGKTSNMNALGLVAGLLDRPLPAVGTTTFRLPYTPVTFGAIAGPNRAHLFDPVRTTPIHEWAAAHGATFENVALWKRAWYFPKAGETMREAVARECRAVRTGVGLFDASTLGKIEVVGPDAAAFMNRIYTNAWLKLEPGRCRYGLMLKEDGYILDDGVVARLSHDRFHVTTTTGGAARVLNHMEDYLQTEWPDLKVHLTSISEQYAVLAVQGPKAREVIAAAGVGHRSVAGGLSAHGGADRLHLRRSLPAVPRLVHGRARLRDQRARGLRAGRLGGHRTSAGSPSASRPTGRKPCTCCGPRRASSSSARKRTAR